MTSGKQIRMGVAGGGFGTSFAWHLHPNSSVAAVCDANPVAREAMAKAFECDTAYASFEELIADPSVDAVAVFTPAPDHARHSIAALRAGKHVVCAVPAALTIEDCEKLLAAVKETGLTYMMAETSYYYQAAISARMFHDQGKFGNIYYTEAEYHHAGLEALYFDREGKPTWRHGLPPMLYPTHCTAFLVGITGERLTKVSCVGWGDDSPIFRSNAYNNPFWNETAFFTTDRGNAMRVGIYWKGAHRCAERAQWFGDKMSFLMHEPHLGGPAIVRSGEEAAASGAPDLEQYEQPLWWQTDMLPEPLRFDNGHDGSHGFIVHEFVSALIDGRRPTVDIREALAYTAPGIIAHESALRGGEQMAVPGFDS